MSKERTKMRSKTSAVGKALHAATYEEKFPADRAACAGHRQHRYLFGFGFSFDASSSPIPSSDESNLTFICASSSVRFRV